MAYSIELYARAPIDLDRDQLLAAMRSHLGDVDSPEPKADRATQMFILKDHIAHYQDGSIPAQLVLLPASDGAPDLTKFDAVFEQSWSFRNAREVMETCAHSCLYSDLMSAALPQDQRRRLLAAGLLAILSCAKIDAVYFPETQQFLQPAHLLAELSQPAQQANPLAGFLNVRFFNVAGSPGDMVMDTLGLAPFGLTDLQLHFRGLEPNDAARILYNTAAYVFERGDVIEAGHTVQGRQSDERWRCQHEDSLVEPKRTVLDVNPGTPYAAGRRAA
jgi:hypothetical protein